MDKIIHIVLIKLTVFEYKPIVKLQPMRLKANKQI
jgi:hypothetical protein